jgi:hypothetical protein
MKRFGTSGVSRDRVDLNELLAWSKSCYQRNKEYIDYEAAKKKTKKEVQDLMARNNVLSKIERNKLMEAEFQKKIELKLSLAAVAILKGNDKAASMLETTETFINVSEFKDVLTQMEIFLSNLEFACLVNAFVADQGSPNSKSYQSHASGPSKWGSGQTAEIINFDGFRGYMTSLMRECANVVRQGRAVDDFKSALSHGQHIGTDALSGHGKHSSSAIKEADNETEEESAYDNESFETSEDASKFSSNLLKTEKALHSRAKKRDIASNIANNGETRAHHHRNANSVKLLYDDSISIQDVESPGKYSSVDGKMQSIKARPLAQLSDADVKSSSDVTSPPKPSETEEASGISDNKSPPRASVTAVVDWISDPLHSFDAKNCFQAV